MARTKRKLIEPADIPTFEAEAVNIFLRAGWAAEDARWLAPLCCSILRADYPDDAVLDDLTEHNLGLIAGAAKEANPLNCRDRALLITFVRLCDYGGHNFRLPRRVLSLDETKSKPPKAPMGLEEWKGIAKVFREHGAKFEHAIVADGWPGEYGKDSELNGVLMQYVRDEPQSFFDRPELLRLMHVLVDGAGLDLTSIIDAGSLVAIGCRRSVPDPAMPLRVPQEVDRKRPPITDARSLTTWMIGLGPRALAMFFPVFQACPNDQYLAAMAVGVQDAIEHWLMCGTHHWTYFREGGRRLASAAEPYLKHLQSKCTGTGEIEPQLRRSWLWFAWCVFEADRNLWQSLSENEQELVLRAANEDLSRLRPLFARARLKPSAPALSGEGFGQLLPDETRAPWEEFKWEEPHFTTCVMLLYQFGGVWRGMKPLLLAIRSFACPCVARDLRHWQEAVESTMLGAGNELAQPPDPWSLVPGSMINLFHYYIDREQAADPDLTVLRGELAAFCLERLGDRWTKAQRAEAEKTGRKRTDEDMVERSPEWRECLVRAVSSLYINPEGKGHRILQKLADIDPDKEVQIAANAAYEQIRRFKVLPENVSPRRTVMSALWWIRQAHLLGLDVPLDEDGAQRTRAKELNRTKEMERADKLAMRKAQ